MCGIVGLFLKDRSLEPKLGAMLSEMLVSLSDRGPDSAGIAIYGEEREGYGKITVQSPEPGKDFKALEATAGNATADAQLLALKQKMGLIAAPAPDTNKQLAAGAGEAEEIADAEEIPDENSTR